MLRIRSCPIAQIWLRTPFMILFTEKAAFDVHRSGFFDALSKLRRFFLFSH
jgi:hypothetical protein